MNLQLDSRIYDIDLTHLSGYLPWENQRLFFLGPPGEEHYRMLAFLSCQLPPGAKASDLGTAYGSSAIALAYNPTIQVATYDPDDYVNTQGWANHRIYKDIPNIRYHQTDCLGEVDNFIDSSIILLDINPHGGWQEKKLIDDLCSKGYRGIMICDDIRLNREMKDFWDSIHLKKYDVTGYGHWSGTGVIIFDESELGLEVV